MPNSIIISIASSQATLEEAIKHDFVEVVHEVVFDSRHDWLAASWTPSTIGQASTCRPTNATASRAGHARNQLIDELFLRDQRLQQADTIMAELQDKMYSVKTKHNPPERPAKPDAIRVIKSVMDNQTLGQAIDQAKQELKTVRPQIANDKSPTTNRRPNPATATTTTC